MNVFKTMNQVSILKKEVRNNFQNKDATRIFNFPILFNGKKSFEIFLILKNKSELLKCSKI